LTQRNGNNLHLNLPPSIILFIRRRQASFTSISFMKKRNLDFFPSENIRKFIFRPQTLGRPACTFFLPQVSLILFERLQALRRFRTQQTC
jgi:hypothetical protein